MRSSVHALRIGTGSQLTKASRRPSPPKARPTTMSGGKRPKAVAELRGVMALQPFPRDAVQLLGVLGDQRWRGPEHEPDAVLLRPMQRVAKVGALLAT